MESKQLAENICNILSESKAKDIVQIFVAEKTIIADYFIVCTGLSTLHVKGLAKGLDNELGKIQIDYKHREGFTEGKWIALDYGDVVVHIFHEETRQFYNLERLWQTEDNTVKYE